MSAATCASSAEQQSNFAAQADTATKPLLAQKECGDSLLGGEVAQGFERVQDVFAANFLEGFEECAQVCVYYEGRKVVDLWGAPRDGSGDPQHAYGPSSLQNVFSSSKALTSLVVALLADRGHLKYEQKVVELWPEYGQEGKEETTIGMVMRHEAGLSKFDEAVEASELTTDRVKAGSLSEFIAQMKPKHTPGEKREYHSVTRGFIVNEIVRRADPAGRTVGEILREDIARPLGLEDELMIGCPAALEQRVAPLTRRSYHHSFREAVLPRCCTGSARPGVQTFKERAATASLAALIPVVGPLAKPWVSIPKLNDSRAGRKVLRDGPSAFNLSEVRRGEVPSANAHCSARAMARVAGCMAESGAVDGVRILSEEGCAKAIGDGVDKPMWGQASCFSNAGWCLSSKAGPGHKRSGWIGWGGLGGSQINWHPETRVGFAYAMNLCDVNPLNGRALALQEAVLACIQEMRRAK